MTAPNPVDQPFRRLFAGFDRDVDPPADLATRLRLRVLAEAELDSPIATHAPPPSTSSVDLVPGVGGQRGLSPTASVAVSGAASPSFLPTPSSSATDEVGRRRRRQPRYLLALEVVAGLILLLGAAAVALRFAAQEEGGAPRFGNSVTAVAGPSTEPQLLWERTDPDLAGTGDLTAGDDLLVRTVQDEHKTGFLWFQQYDYDFYLQALDRRTGELRWLEEIDGYGMSYVTEDAVLFVSYPTTGEGSTDLIAFAPTDGAQLWRTPLTSSPVYASELTFRDGILYLTVSDGVVQAVDLATGAVAWSTPLGEPRGDRASSFRPSGYVTSASLILDGDRLLTLDPTGATVELDAATGAVVATHATTVTLPTTVYEGRLFATADRLVTVVTGTDEAFDQENPSQPRTVLRASAVDRATGREVWSTEQFGDTGLLTQTGDRLVVWRYDSVDVAASGTVQALDIATGAVLWTALPPAGYPIVSLSASTTSDGQLLVGTQTGEVIALDVATGDERWRYTVGATVQMPPNVSGGLAFTSDQPDHLIALALPENE